MLDLIAIALVIIWLLFLVSTHTMGGLIHLLLVLAALTMLVRFIRGNKPFV